VIFWYLSTAFLPLQSYPIPFRFRFDHSHRKIPRNGKAELRFILRLVALHDQVQELGSGFNGTGVCGKPLHFKGSVFHRIIKGFMMQGGVGELGEIPTRHET
jgi:hypothetical protein